MLEDVGFPNCCGDSHGGRGGGSAEPGWLPDLPQLAVRACVFVHTNTNLPPIIQLQSGSQRQLAGWGSIALAWHPVVLPGGLPATDLSSPTKLKRRTRRTERASSENILPQPGSSKFPPVCPDTGCACCQGRRFSGIQRGQ